MTRAQEMQAESRAILDEMHDLLAGRHIRIMEVCGTHTVAIFRAGLRQILPPEVELVRTHASIEKAVGAWEATRVAACDLLLASEVMVNEAPEPRTDPPPRL